MKKIISLALVCIMMLGMLSMVSFADTVEITVGKYGEGMENWSGQTQVLICPKDGEGAKLAALYGADIEWTIKFTGVDGSEKTVTMKHSTQYDGGSWGILRFQPCLEEGANQFIPKKNCSYTVEVTATVDGTTYHGVSAEYDFKIPAYPIVNGAEDTTQEYTIPAAEYPYELTLGEYHTGDDSAYASDWETYADKETLILMFRGDIYATDDFVEGGKVILTIDGTDYECTLPAGPTYVFAGDNVLVRIPTEGVFTPTEGTKYSVSAKYYAPDGTLMYTTNTIDTVTYGEVAKEADTPVEPPKNGDATVFAVVFATVAVLGMAVVVTKKVHA